MATVSVEILTYTAVGIVITILGFVFLFVIGSGLVKAAYEQTAFANVEKLRSAIDEACFKGEGNIVELDFELPQRLPPSIWLLEEWFYEHIIGELIIRPSGDPEYIVYYEMFPPGEAIGWEVYHDFGYRAIVMLPEGATLSTAGSFIEELRAEAKGMLGAKLIDKPLDVFIGNVELTSSFDPSTGEPAERGYGEFFGIGEWEEMGLYDRSDFIFDNYLALSAMNKTFLKYQPCGENSLCLKTTKGIYSYPLKYCKEAGIEYVQLVNTAEHIQDKYSDFYLASPCKSKESVEIYFDEDCRDSIFYFSWAEHLLFSELPGGGCEKTATYPIYRYSNGKLDEIGNHTTCLDMISNEGMSDPLPCVRVVFRGKEGFCYTQNLKEPWKKWILGFCGVPPLSLITGIVDIVNSFDPVSDYTHYISDNKFILEPGEIPSLGARFKPGEVWIWP